MMEVKYTKFPETQSDSDSDSDVKAVEKSTD